MEVERYLDRIGLPRGLPPTLTELHERHLLTVPFENLDIHRNVPIVLEEERLLRKIVDRRRGGFCYELNGAFAWLLRSLGMRVALLSAEVAHDDGTWGIPFDHMVLRVDLDLSWLVDVGFGDGFLYPVPLDGDPVRQVGECYRVCADDNWRILEREEKPQYRFKLDTYELQDFESGCHHHQTSPESTFTQKRVFSVARPAGRLTLTEDRLIETRKGERTETPVDDFDTALEEHFGVWA
jgi:N-hydroxyarylamine O-acetyltransferase